jgi:Asp/Glu/hydantoin racemase
MYTAPQESPASIDNGLDVTASSEAVYRDLQKTGLIQGYDAALVACYSVHPLVHRLQEEPGRHGRVAVIGIFEASILASLSLLPQQSPSPTWGIVTTGSFWEEHLSKGVKAFLGQASNDANAKFAGVQSTGLDAADFHGGVSHKVICDRLKTASKRLLRARSVGCVIMGCAGMAGLEDIIREAAVEEYGTANGNQVLIIDGVRAGIGILEQMIKNRQMFQET